MGRLAGTPRNSLMIVQPRDLQDNSLRSVDGPDFVLIKHSALSLTQLAERLAVLFEREFGKPML